MPIGNENISALHHLRKADHPVADGRHGTLTLEGTFLRIASGYAVIRVELMRGRSALHLLPCRNSGSTLLPLCLEPLKVGFHSKVDLLGEVANLLHVARHEYRMGMFRAIAIIVHIPTSLELSQELRSGQHKHWIPLLAGFELWASPASNGRYLLFFLCCQLLSKRGEAQNRSRKQLR